MFNNIFIFLYAYKCGYYSLNWEVFSHERIGESIEYKVAWSKADLGATPWEHVTQCTYLTTARLTPNFVICTINRRPISGRR